MSDETGQPPKAEAYKRKTDRKSLKTKHKEETAAAALGEQVASIAAAVASAAETQEAAAAKPNTPPASSETSKAPAKKGKKKAGKGTTIGDRIFFSQALENFLYDNVTFESSAAVKAAMVDINKATKLNDAFLVPMQHKILNMDGCLRLLLFMQLVGAQPIEDDSAFTGSAKFVTDAAIKAIAECFDDGVQDAIWEHVDAAQGDESGSESD